MSETKPPADDSSKKEVDFELGMDVVYRDGNGKNVPAVYERSSANGLKHTIRLEYGARLNSNDRNLQLIYQPDLLNIPKNPLDYRN